MNLLVNAAQAISDHGEVTISTTLDEYSVIVAISDSGSGIPDDELSKIFDPFFTTKPVGEGTGLGLSISYGIIERHRGTISVESQVGEGTTFTVRIPIRKHESGWSLK
jgi:signal transduction histidine kinase